MITKCDFPGCTRAGTRRAPKTRELREYYHFCPEHAAEYNKNWNYYADMTPEEIERDWEKRVFGTEINRDAEPTDYTKFINDFLTGRAKFDTMKPRTSLPSNVVSSFKTLGLTITATKKEVGIAFRKMAKIHHPDTGGSGDVFTKITNAKSILDEYFNNKKS